MTVNEGKAGLVEIESDGNRSFISTLASEACLYFGGTYLVDPFFVNVSDVKKDVAPYHWLLRDTNVLSFLA